MNSAQVAEILHKPVLPALITSLSDLTPEIIQALVEKSAEWHEQRSKCIGGSDANRIMKGQTYQVWLEKTGRAEPEDLTKNLNVILGIFTEPFNRYWFLQCTGLYVKMPTRVAHPEYEFLAVNLDGICEGYPWEAKHTNQFSKNEDVLQWYYPQLQHQMMVTGRDKAILSVIFGNGRFQEFTIDADYPYQQQLIAREMELWQCIQNDTPPEGFTPTVEVSFSDMREVDMSESNSWAEWAAKWVANKGPAKEFEVATKELKAMIENDVCLAYGHGIKVPRSKNGSLTIKEM